MDPKTRRCGSCGALLDATLYTSRCPKYETCSVNACPLDVKIRPSVPGDPQQTCRAHLRARLRIARQAEEEGVVLPWRGFRPDEQDRIKAGETVEALVAEWDAREAALRGKGLRLKRPKPG